MMKLNKSTVILLLILSLTFLIGFAVTENTDTHEKIEGYVVGVEPNTSAGYSSIKVLDMAGTEHNITVSSIDLEKKGIRLGDKVKVNITRDANGNIKSEQTEINEASIGTSGEVIQGEVTNVNNSDPAGSSELTVKDNDGKEHVVNVPLYQGENLKPGDKVSIKVVGKAERLIGSVSSVESPEENTDKESHSSPGISGVFAAFAVLISAVYKRRALKRT